MLLDLAARVAEGDRDAFGRVYDLLVDEVFRFVRGQIHDDSATDDIVADTFLRAWRSARSFRAASGGYRQWIFAIARNRIRSHWAARARDGSALVEDVATETDFTTDQDREDELFDARLAVWKALRVLTTEQREVVSLRYFSGWSHAEIARVMGKREGAVRALLVRALKRMRQEIGDAAL